MKSTFKHHFRGDLGEWDFGKCSRSLFYENPVAFFWKTVNTSTFLTIIMTVVYSLIMSHESVRILLDILLRVCATLIE